MEISGSFGGMQSSISNNKLSSLYAVRYCKSTPTNSCRCAYTLPSSLNLLQRYVLEVAIYCLIPRELKDTADAGFGLCCIDNECPGKGAPQTGKRGLRREGRDMGKCCARLEGEGWVDVATLFFGVWINHRALYDECSTASRPCSILGLLYPEEKCMCRSVA